MGSGGIGHALAGDLADDRAMKERLSQVQLWIGAALVALLALGCGGSTEPKAGDAGDVKDGSGDNADAPGEPGADGGGQSSARARVLALLHEISGSRVVAGQHNREPNSEPSKWTAAIQQTTGKVPGLWSGDFLFQQDNIAHRPAMIAEASKQWAEGALVNLMWHACPPTQGEPCGWEGGVTSHLTDEEWEKLITDGTPLNRTWKARLDDIAGFLGQLQAQGVGVMFRPFHEMNQGMFWWGGRPGERGTRRLYQLTHDYLTIEKGLGELVWIWDVQDLSWDFAEYDPGARNWDVFALDVYGDGFTDAKYQAMLEIAGDRPIAIGECARLPMASELAAQPRWTFFMAWAELVYESNSDEEINSVYGAPAVLTRDELPGWH
jgi:mannan endo-1,4-beta-mannosidase